MAKAAYVKGDVYLIGQNVGMVVELRFENLDEARAVCDKLRLLVEGTWQKKMDVVFVHPDYVDFEGEDFEQIIQQIAQEWL